LHNSEEVTQQLSILIPLSALNLLYNQLAYLESECGTVIYKISMKQKIISPKNEEEPSRDPHYMFCGILGFRGTPVEEH